MIRVKFYTIQVMLVFAYMGERGPYRRSQELNGIFDESVSLPEGLTTSQLEEAMKTVRSIFKAINEGLSKYDMPPINELVRLNQYSGMLSDFMTRLLDRLSSFKKLTNTDFPDLRNPSTGVGLEIKATTREPWGTVGHNVARGWFLTIEYELDSEGLPSFKTVWIGELVEEDFTWYGRSSESKRTITASVKRESWNRKMLKVFQRVSGEGVLTFIK
jgi:hypothetical protein